MIFTICDEASARDGKSASIWGFGFCTSIKHSRILVTSAGIEPLPSFPPSNGVNSNRFLDPTITSTDHMSRQ